MMRLSQVFKKGSQRPHSGSSQNALLAASTAAGSPDPRFSYTSNAYIWPPELAGVDFLTIVLTGSTGNFGTHLLNALFTTSDLAVHKIICVNRSDDARQRQKQALEARGFDSPPRTIEVQYWTADFGAPRWGLTDTQCNVFRTEVDIVIHNAWPVDFNRTFQSFGSSIDGVKSLISMVKQEPTPSQPYSESMVSFNRRPKRSDSGIHRSDMNGSASVPPSNTVPATPAPADPSSAPCSTQRKDTRLLFISSISVASTWSSSAPTSRATVPEEEITEWKVARTGYGQSKLVSERILALAARQHGTNMSIVRVGQIAGPVSEPSKMRSEWPRQEWFPSLMLSCQELGALPQTLGPAEGVDWVPVDVCARVVLDLLGELQRRGKGGDGEKGKKKGKKKNHPARFFHVTNPHPVAFATFLPAIRPFFSQGTREMPFAQWVELLKTRKTDVKKVPAAKLMSWFDYLRDKAVRFPDTRSPVFETKHTVADSKTLADLNAVSARWMKLWLRQWGFHKSDQTKQHSSNQLSRYM